MADYDRFAGGRLASVEVHGGATLEEILIPVIEFSLKNIENEIKSATEEITPEPLKNFDEGFDFFE
ncbi:MAG: hypothetical protein IK062_04090 [Selenomonadaceae bacterium]|nr:hypothetical protein [Selenomonadaceae bacterium]